MKTTLIGKSLAAITVAAAALFWSGDLPAAANGSFVASAQAWVGAPATPRSFAGVARRTTRRAVATGVAVGTAAVVGTAAATAATTGCARVVDRYGRIVTVCR
jgi:hypothetical protein